MAVCKAGDSLVGSPVGDFLASMAVVVDCTVEACSALALPDY